MGDREVRQARWLAAALLSGAVACGGDGSAEPAPVDDGVLVHVGLTDAVTRRTAEVGEWWLEVNGVNVGQEPWITAPAQGTLVIPNSEPMYGPMALDVTIPADGSVSLELTPTGLSFLHASWRSIPDSTTVDIDLRHPAGLGTVVLDSVAVIVFECRTNDGLCLGTLPQDWIVDQFVEAPGRFVASWAPADSTGSLHLRIDRPGWPLAGTWHAGASVFMHDQRGNFTAGVGGLLFTITPDVTIFDGHTPRS